MGLFGNCRFIPREEGVQPLIGVIGFGHVSMVRTIRPLRDTRNNGISHHDFGDGGPMRADVGFRQNGSFCLSCAASGGFA
jgi:hypothetical protein